jgi:anti-sigma factor RsiW
MSACGRIGPLLDAYHDGELGRLRRWSVRRHVAACPACREELAALRGVGAWVRDAVDAAPGPDPELWSDLRWRLPARMAPPPVRSRRDGDAARERPGRAAFGMPVLGAGVVVASLALLVLVGPPGLFERAASTVVRSLNTHGRPVMVLNRPNEATIIWLMDDERVQSAEDSASVWI